MRTKNKRYVLYTFIELGDILRKEQLNILKTYKWNLMFDFQLSTGNLLAVLDKHYQRVTCIRFTDDGSHFVTGGADNLVLVWSFSRCAFGLRLCIVSMHNNKLIAI